MTRIERLRHGGEIDRVFREGSWRRLPALALGVLRRGDDGPTRVAITAGKRVGTAVRRNRARRRLREAWRLLADRVGTGANVVVVAREPTVEVEFACLQQQLAEALACAGLLVDAEEGRG